MTSKNPKIRKLLSCILFIAAFCWLFMAIGIALFEYDPGVLTRTISFLLAAAYFYQLYEKNTRPEDK
ncbi:hypothetical protein [Metabacillus sp. SLBN-84]